MVLVGAAILPHGALTFDGNAEDSNCRERHEHLSDDLRASITRVGIYVLFPDHKTRAF